MSYDIRKPLISAPTPEGQLSQVKSYLLQLVEQLNFALHTLEKNSGNGSATNSGASSGSAAAVFSEIKSLIMKSSDIVSAHFAQMEPMICESEMLLDLIKANGSGGGIDTEQLNAAVAEALRNAKESGEFDGTDGVSATHEWNGTTLTVTSASGTSSANLKGEKGNDGTSVTITSITESTLDGGVNTVTFSDGNVLNIKNGSAGSAGDFGGVSEADKNEIVSMVLASLPTWNGGSY